MQQYSLLTIHQLEELETASFMYKYLYDDLPVPFVLHFLQFNCKF